MRIALIGTRGVPARYGGFETAIEEIGPRLATRGHEITVYCRNPGQKQTEYLGMRLVNLPALRRRSLETLSHSLLSVAHAVVSLRPDVAILFNAANAPLLPILNVARIPVAVHMDGLEWKRAKWAGAGAKYYRSAERWSARFADECIADARGISEHLLREHGRDSVYIPYGAELVHLDGSRLREIGLVRHEYHLVVARFEPENHVREIVAGYTASPARFPLIVVGSAPYSDDYTRSVHAAAGNDPRVQFVGGVWDQELLNDLYGGTLTYCHGHSVGGTNPSLLRAMGAGAPVVAHDNVFNREVTGGFARFFSKPADIAASLLADEADQVGALERGAKGRSHAAEEYSWESVADDYERLCRQLNRGV